MDEEYDPTAFLDEGERCSEEEQDARIESELPPFKYDPFKHRDSENRHRRMDTDTAVELQNQRERLDAHHREVRDNFYRGFIDSSSPSETSFDARREGRSAT